MTELDAAGPGLSALAAIAERGECIERGLLAAAPRAACEQAVAAWRAEWERYEATRDLAVAASRAIATTGFDQGGHRAAVYEFWSARDELARTWQYRERSRNSAHHAMSQLEHDRILRQRHAGELEQGRRARDELDSLLGARLTEALEWEWPLPSWFTAVLGSAQPTAEPGHWRATAVALLSYRISYRVRTAESALGPRPGPSTCARRRQWFGELDRELTRGSVRSRG